MKRQTVSLKQLSRAVGVSASTISRVLNGYNEGFSVKPEVREKILRAVQQSGYRPNPFVRSLRAKRTMMVTWLTYKQGGRADTGVDESVLQSMARALAAENYTVSCNFLTEAEPEQYSAHWPVDGLAISDVIDPSKLTRIAAAGIPCVVVNGISGPGVSSVMVDEEQCARLLLGFLFDNGHRRIAYYNKQTSTERLLRHYSVSERYTAYLEFMQRIGVRPPPGHERYDIGAVDFLRAVRADGATAIVCYDHLNMFSLLHAAHRLGVDIPEQLSVTCFNDMHPLEYAIPPVTCVAIPCEEMGRTAASLLLADMKSGAGARVGQTIRIPGTLVVRESVKRIAAGSSSGS